MSDKQEWVVWNGSVGILDMAALGRIETGTSGRNAWLAEPYDVVGPFCLDELEAAGRIEFEACTVLSRARWKAEQIELRRKAQAERRESARRFAAMFGSDDGDDDSEDRALLELPEDGLLSAQEINAAFRRIAKKAHPDTGGDHETYIRLTEARDALLERVTY